MKNVKSYNRIMFVNICKIAWKNCDKLFYWKEYRVYKLNVFYEQYYLVTWHCLIGREFEQCQFLEDKIWHHKIKCHSVETFGYTFRVSLCAVIQLYRRYNRLSMHHSITSCKRDRYHRHDSDTILPPEQSMCNFPL